LRERLEASGATMMQATPATWRLLLDTGWKGTKRLKLLCGGEALAPALASSLLMRSRSLWNMYGPTETTVWSTLAPVETADGNSSIGQPIANTQIYVLDASFNPVPVGVPGELYIGGDGLARGYLNRPELTAEKFIPNPFTPPYTPPRKLGGAGGGRLYRTGDLVRYLPDGNLEFLGRIDHQVKVRGHRIELGEIESALAEHPSVREAVVIVREDQPGDPLAGAGKRLVAYAVLRASAEVSVSELRSALKARLPEYMLPSAFVFLDQLPLTPNGKIDRKALPAPDGARPTFSTQWTAPRNPIEEQLAKVWAVVLRLKQVGIYDDFFESGGDSLLSLQVIALARQAGLDLTPKQIFQHRTIAELAAAANTMPKVRAEQEMLSGPVALTPNQLWFLERDLPHLERRMIALEVEARAPLAPEYLKQVTQFLLMHHDALRARFVREKSHWRQLIVEPDERVPFTYIDLSSLPQAEQDAAMQKVAVQIQTSLHLAQGPLVQIVHFDLGTTRLGRLLLIMHLLISDAYSLQVLAADFQTAYQQLMRDQAIQLESKTTSYKAWADKLSAHAQSTDILHELDYWVGLPWERIAHPRLDAVDETGNTIASTRIQTLSLNKDETDTLLKIYSTGLQDVLLTAFGQTLAYWTESPCVVFVLIDNGRETVFEDIDLSRTVGRFALGHPVVLDMTDARTPREALSAVKGQLARIPNHGITYGVLHLVEDEDVKAKVRKLDEDSSRLKVIFNYIPPTVSNLPSDALFQLVPRAVDLREDPQNRRDYILKCTVNIVHNQLIVNWEYSTNLHKRGTIEAIIQFYLDAVRALA
jgi:non-ribosomal peptide synthase protein (TIGR01720 family)